jgi:2-polyprenyl-3-methyl-5-hydroxy-6-metoxy-1,4-benzoquinol methylase
MNLSIKREYVRCALCGEDRTRVRYTIDIQSRQLSQVRWRGQEYQLQGDETIVQCAVCGLVYVNPRLPVDADMMPYTIEHELAYFQATRAQRQVAYRALLAQLAGWVGAPVRTLLDIGCGDGVLLEEAHRVGIASTGTEISAVLLRLVRERLGNAVTVTDDLEALPSAHYDVVTLLNVLEHATDPLALVDIALQRLRPGGILLVHVPNLHGLPARLRGARWQHIEPLGHLYYFSPRTLGMLLAKAGLQPLGRFNLVVAQGIRASLQRGLGALGLYLDNGLGMVARRPA